MKLPMNVVLLAAIVAIPIEAVNFWLLPFPIDVGLPDDASWYQNLIGSQWVIVHLPGLRSIDWFNRMGFRGHDGLIVFVSGYLDTVLLLIVCILAFRWLRQLARKPSATQNQLTN
jgi:hypothetical protein